MNYLKLIRYPNLVLIAFMLLTFHYGFLKFQDISLALNDWQFGLFVLATILIAAAGYVINDIMDQEVDQENKPEKLIVGHSISESKAYNLYLLLTITGTLIGFYLSYYVINKTSFFGLFVIYSILLYVYATDVKQIPFLKNILVAFILALSVISVGMFDVIPIIIPDNDAKVKLVLSIILDYAIFAFILNLIREIVKDLEDYSGDFNQGIRTIPVLFGIKKTVRLVVVLGVIAAILLLGYINNNLMNFKLYYATIYALSVVVAPLIFFLIKIWNATTKEEYHRLSSILKWIIFFGILSILIITLNIVHNAKG